MVTNVQHDGSNLRLVLLGPDLIRYMSFFEYVMSLGPRATQEFADSKIAKEGWANGQSPAFAFHDFYYQDKPVLQPVAA